MKYLKNLMNIVIMSGAFIALATFISLFFVKGHTYFTTMLIINIIVDFAVIGFVLLFDDKVSNISRFTKLLVFLAFSIIFLLLDIIVISNLWDFTSYATLMYVTNMKLYLVIYSVFALVMIFVSGYAILKGFYNSNNIRQNSSKQSEI